MEKRLLSPLSLHVRRPAYIHQSYVWPRILTFLWKFPLHSLDGGEPNNLAVGWIEPQDCSVIDSIVSFHSRSIYFTGILITIAPMTLLILKSRLGLS